MISVQVKRCKILKEFSPEQKNEFFSIHRDKTLHHIDTLYYSVKINEPDEVIKLQSEDKLPENLKSFLNKLRDMKAYCRGNEGKVIEIAGMEAASKVFSMYEFCVSLNECFDIFIASYLPTSETPRIVVQLRSRYLVLEGVKKALDQSFNYLLNLLEPFELFPEVVRENRIDYAFHTNLIQNPYKFFRDENLQKHLKTNLRKYQKIGNIGEDITVDTFNLGNRKSNNVYFRAYNKAREVIEMNYKAFFIERWYENGLISQFDKYIYEIAYELKSYRTGILVGRLKWYLEYGSNDELKELCKKLLKSDFINSDNCSHIEAKIKGVIPEPTLIVNIEYQTKRKFYMTCSKWIKSFVSSEDLKLYSEIDPEGLSDMLVKCDFGAEYLNPMACHPLLKDLYIILGNARAIVDYLTGFGNVVSFVDDRKMSYKEFIEEGEPYMSWWKRIRGTPIDYSADKILDVYRTYDLNCNIKKSRRSLLGSISRVAMLNKNTANPASFVEDMTDVLCVLNDNDLPPIQIYVDENGEIMQPEDYEEISLRKARQLRGILKKASEPVENN